MDILAGRNSDKIYVFSLSTSQHEDALSHEYTNFSKLEHNSIVTPSYSQFKFWQL
jgi:hypothetical protein